MKIRSPYVVLAAVVGIGWLVLHLVTLNRYPPVSCDEAFYSQIAYTFLREGRFGFDALRGLGGTDVNVIYVGRFHIALLALFEAVFGPTPWSVRLLSLLASVGAAWVLYDLGRSMYGPRVGLAAALLFHASWKTLLHAHSGRPDMVLAAAAAILLWLVWRTFESPTMWRGLLVGLASVLAVDIHPNGLVFASTACLMTVVFAGYRREWKVAAACVAGGLLGLAYWVPAHLLPDVRVFFEQAELYSRLTVTPWVNASDLWGLAGLGRFYWREFVARHNYLAALPAVFYAFGMAYTALDKRRPSRFLIVFFVLANVLFTFTTAVKAWYYAVLWLPLLSIMTAIALDGVARWLADRPVGANFTVERLWLIVLLPLLLIFLSADVYLMYKYRTADFQSYAQRLQEMIPAGETMVAEHRWWYARPDEDFVAAMLVDWVDQTDERGPLTPARFRTLFNEIGPPYYVVMDEVWNCNTQQPPNYEAMYAMINAQCEAVGTVEADWYEASEVYYCPVPFE